MWNQICSFSIKSPTNIIRINDDELMVLDNESSFKTNQIKGQIYNITTDNCRNVKMNGKSTMFVSYPRYITYHQQSDKVYYSTGDQLVSCDFNNSKFTTTFLEQYDPFPPYLTFINANQVTMISVPYLKFKVCTYNLDTKKQTIYETYKESVSGRGLIYEATKNRVFEFCGDIAPTRIRTFDVNKKEWQTLNTILPTKMTRSGQMALTITNNNRYIIIFHDDAIFYLDLQKQRMKIEPSLIKVPCGAVSSATLILHKHVNQILVDGYVRRYVINEFKMKYPFYLNKLIQRYDNENWWKVHVIGTNREHWKIKLNEIITNHI